MYKKLLHPIIVVATICSVSVSCAPIDDSFLEGEWLCPKVTVIHNSDGSITHEWTGAGAMTFDTKNKKVYLYNGCNYSTGYYSLSFDSVLNYTTDGMSTELYCSCSTSSGGKGRIRRLIKDETDGFEFNDVSKTLMLRPGRWFLRGDWELARLQNEEIEVPDITVGFNLKKGLVTLSESGGATFTLPFSTGPDCSISFDTSVLKDSTAKLNNTWRELIDSLNKTTLYKISSGGCWGFIEFCNNTDIVLFTIERVEEEIDQ